MAADAKMALSADAVSAAQDQNTENLGDDTPRLLGTPNKHKRNQIMPGDNNQRLHTPRAGSGMGAGSVPADTHRKLPKFAGIMLNPWGGNRHPLSDTKGALTVTVKTGSVEGAGTDSRIWMRIHGRDKDCYSPIFELQHFRNRHSFSQGQLFKFDLLAPYPVVSLRDDVTHIKKTGEDIYPLCSDIKKVEIWRDDGRDVALDGEDPSWFLNRVTIEEPHTGESWDFICDDWVGMTMTKQALQAIDAPPEELVDPARAKSMIAACSPGAKLEHPVRYDNMRLQKAAGLVNVSNSETELQWWAAQDGKRHYILFATVDKFISALIIFTIVCDIFREEVVKTCLLNQLEYEADVESSTGCGWASGASSLYPFLLALDLFILVLFLVELITRFTLKYWGLRNVFAYVLRAYNRRYRKIGLDAFKKNGIRRSDRKRYKNPWFMTLVADGNQQFRKEFEDVMDSDLHARQRIPFNFMASETMTVVVFELVIVVAALITQSVYIGVSKGTVDTQLTGNTIAKVVSIMRIVRVTRIVTRIHKLRQLVTALAQAFSGVLWILVLVLVGSYGYAIVGVMAFQVGDASDADLITDDECDSDCVAEGIEGYFGNLWNAGKTLFFNILLGDNIGDMMAGVYNGPARSWIYAYVVSYLVIIVFLLMEAVTGYIVEIISSKYQDQKAIDALPFAAVARVRVVDWFSSLKLHPNKNNDNYHTGEQPWLGAWINDAIKNGDINIESIGHVRRMLKQVQKYNIEFAQMEFEPSPGSAGVEPSDWLISVRSEAEMARLLEHGFMYWDKTEDGAPKNPSPWDYELDPETDGPIALTIPVTREHHGELIQLVGLRAPSFAVEDHVHDAFRDFGVVLKVEREKWDLPEDPHNPQEIAQLEETNTLLWRVRLYQNDKQFPVLPIEEFDHEQKAQLERRAMLECQAVEIYGQMCPILPDRLERPHQKTRSHAKVNDTGLVHTLHRFTMSELLEFAMTFTPHEEDHRESIDAALDSDLPKEALIKHLVAPRCVLMMIQVPDDQPFPRQPISEKAKQLEKSKSSTGPRQTFREMSWKKLMVHVEHYRKQGLITNDDDARADANPGKIQEIWVDILCRIEHEASKGSGGSGWKSKWVELRQATETLKVSLYMTCAGIRDLTGLQLAARALDDSGVTQAELNSAIASEMWARVDNNDKVEALIREELGPLLSKIVEDAKHYLDADKISPSSESETVLEPEPESDLHAYYEESFLGHQYKQTGDLAQAVNELDCFFFIWDNNKKRFTSDYITEHKVALHGEVAEMIIRCVDDRKRPMLPEIDRLSARREGAMKAILRHFKIGGTKMVDLDRQLEKLSNSARSHSDTLSRFRIHELYRLAKVERLHHKFNDHYLHMRANEDEKGELQDQLSAALDSDDPKKNLLWRLLEAGADPAPIHLDPDGLDQMATQGLSLALTVPTDGWEQTENELRELKRKKLSPNVYRMLDKAHLKVRKVGRQMGVSETRLPPTRQPTRHAAWASKMSKDLEKVCNTSEKLDRHTVSAMCTICRRQDFPCRCPHTRCGIVRWLSTD